VEGADLVAAGIAAGHRPQAVFVREERAEELAARLGVTGEAGGVAVVAYPVTERVAARISTLDTPPAAQAVFPLPERRPLGSLVGSGGGPKAAALQKEAGAATAERSIAGRPATELLVVYADAIADPGNLGTLVRAAVAFGATALVTSPGSADLYGPKVVRAGMGAVFGLPLFPEQALSAVTAALHADEVYGLAAHGGVPLAEADLRRPAVLVVGAERAGLSPEARELVTTTVTIPLAPARAGAVESLNAGVAGAIALYELSRRAPRGADDQQGRPPAPREG
jgi:tRNA G18 (ribose-2'-O)-methylase SpoU